VVRRKTSGHYRVKLSSLPIKSKRVKNSKRCHFSPSSDTVTSHFRSCISYSAICSCSCWNWDTGLMYPSMRKSPVVTCLQPPAANSFRSDQTTRRFRFCWKRLGATPCENDKCSLGYITYTYVWNELRRRKKGIHEVLLASRTDGRKRSRKRPLEWEDRVERNGSDSGTERVREPLTNLLSQHLNDAHESWPKCGYHPTTARRHTPVTIRRHTPVTVHALTPGNASKIIKKALTGLEARV